MSSTCKRNSSFVDLAGCAVLVFSCFRKKSTDSITECASLVYFSDTVECRIACFILYSVL